MTGKRWWGSLLILLIIALVAREGLLLVFVLVLALAGGISELWARHCLTNVFYRRHFGASHLAFGEETTLTVEFVNAKPLPLAWLAVRDSFPRAVTLLEGTVQGSPSEDRGTLTNVVSLRWYERVLRRYHIRGDHRGIFQFGPAEIRSGDILGFRIQEKRLADVDTLVVYPKVVPIEALGLPADRPMGEWRAQRRVVEDPLRFATVRDYQPGDHPRSIHWKASARLGRLQTKAYDPSATLALMLAVDVQTLPGAYEYRPNALEYTIMAAASLAAHALEERHLVGLCTNSIDAYGHQHLYMPPGRHSQQLQTLLVALASLRPLRGLPFEALLEMMTPQLPFGATVVALTAFLRDEILETLLAVQSAGHPVILLPVGEASPHVPEELTCYPLRGMDGWRDVETIQLA
ncbi:MAG: DUF58 domain-containing protein [Chloroflexi bacterium]|nr:DUF58 domain-containing protein [Chloroflexota bacterium]